jgi:hypothetical protein
MMMVKRIELAPDLKFDSITQARTYFDNIKNSTPLNERVSEGEFKSLRLLYERYCATTSWSINSPPAAFFPTYEKRNGATTKCFGVEFEDGTKVSFSLDKALTAVADATE